MQVKEMKQEEIKQRLNLGVLGMIHDDRDEALEILLDWQEDVLSDVKKLLSLVWLIKFPEELEIFLGGPTPFIDVKFFFKKKKYSEKEIYEITEIAEKLGLLLIDTHTKTVKELLYFLTVLTRCVSLPEVEEIAERIISDVLAIDADIEDCRHTMDCYFVSVFHANEKVFEGIKNDLEMLGNILKEIYKKVKGEPGLYDIEVSWGEKD